MSNEPSDTSYAGHPPTVPMPEHPISDATGQPGPSGPVPEQMPGSSGSQEQASEAATVSALDDYPGGRGGMRMVASGPSDQSGEPATEPQEQIGHRPSAVAMPPPS